MLDLARTLSSGRKDVSGVPGSSKELVPTPLAQERNLIMRRLAFLFIALIVALSLSVVFTGGLAFAAPRTAHAPSQPARLLLGGCWGTGCYNRDPIGLTNPPVYCTNDQSTDDSGSGYLSYTTVITDREGTELAWFRNLYSYSCNANWVYGVLVGGTELKLTISAPGESMLCDPENCSSYFTFANGAWSNMVNGTNVTTACAYTAANEPGDHSTYSACINR